MHFFKAYIDPGTGSMLFAVLFSVIGALFYLARGLFVKVKFIFHGGKKTATNENKINIVIFSDDKRYWSVFNPICREFDKRGVDVVYLTASPDDPALENNYSHIDAQFIGTGNKAFSKLNFLNARILVSTTPGLDVYQWKRSKNVDYYVHVLHAACDVTAYRMFGIDYYDAVLVSGDYQINDIRELERLRNLPEKELVKVGVPYMDEMKKRLETGKTEKNSETTVLLAPSWGESGIFKRFGNEMIDALLKTGYHIIIRPHPQSFISEKDMMDAMIEKYPDSEQIEWNRDADNFEVLNKSDIIISDFSGVIYDFCLVYDKPVIYTDTDFDDSPYDNWWLKRPLWTLTVLPRLGKQVNKENLGNLKSIIDECLNSSEYNEARAEVRNETWAYIGEGSKRTVDYILKKEAELKEKQ